MNVNLLKKICKMQDKALMKMLNKYLLQNGYQKVIMTKEYVLAYGDIDVVICGHLDTVYNRPPRDIYYDSEQQVMLSPQGIGGDDRCFCYTLMHLVEDGYHPNVIIFAHEEDGGSSAYQLLHDFPKPPFENVKYILELDRQGRHDIVTYSNNNREFVKYIESFGFEEAIGTFSDISIIMEPYNWCGGNVSIGYENEHCGCEELIHTNWLEEIIIKLKEILLDSRYSKEVYKYIPITTVDYLNKFNRFWNKQNENKQTQDFDFDF